MVLQYFAANPNVNQTLNQSEDLHNFSDSTNATKFQNVFKLPFAGWRNQPGTIFNNTNLMAQGSDGMYWSSSPNSVYSSNAYHLRLNSRVAIESTRRAYGFSVRCFKDSPDAPATRILTFHENGGDLLGAT